MADAEMDTISSCMSALYQAGASHLSDASLSAKVILSSSQLSLL